MTSCEVRRLGICDEDRGDGGALLSAIEQMMQRACAAGACAPYDYHYVEGGSFQCSGTCPLLTCD